MGHSLSSQPIRVSFHCRGCHMTYDEQSTRWSILNGSLAGSPVYISSLMKFFTWFLEM